MNINIENTSQILSHVLLDDIYLVDKLVSTPEWVELKELKAELTFNGVSVSAASLENTLKRLIDSIEEHYSEKYNADNIDRLVEEKAKELLRVQANNALEVISNLTNKLQESDDLIKYSWEV